MYTAVSNNYQLIKMYQYRASVSVPVYPASAEVNRRESCGRSHVGGLYFLLHCTVPRGTVTAETFPGASRSPQEKAQRLACPPALEIGLPIPTFPRDPPGQ